MASTEEWEQQFSKLDPIDPLAFGAFCTVLAEGIEEMIEPPEARRRFLDGLREISGRTIPARIGPLRAVLVHEWLDSLEEGVEIFESDEPE